MTVPAIVHLIAAARPNFMKIAPLWHMLTATQDFRPIIVHTGQHYDAAMSDDIFADLGLPAPDHHLGIGSGTHAEQTGLVMIAYEKLAMKQRPDWLIVAGDVNSTASAAMAAAKLRIPIVHLEAGLRSRDRQMPEELNRLVTDVLADVLWTPSPDADANLIAEGVPPDRITRVGNIMMDSYELVYPAIAAADCPRQLNLAPHGYGVITLHRPSNVDVPERLDRIIAALIAVQTHLPLVFPVHPRTRDRLGAEGVARLERAGVIMIGPAAYVRFMSLVSGAAAVITDSGGIQEETTYLGIPCLTLRENTERPITISEGTAQLVSADTLLDRLLAAVAEPRRHRKRPALWDGHTAERCLADLRRRSPV